MYEYRYYIIYSNNMIIFIILFFPKFLWSLDPSITYTYIPLKCLLKF